MAGRKIILTPTIQKRICDAIRKGSYDYAAAQFAGISRSAFFEWLQRGRDEESGPFVEFVDAVEAARAECRVKAEIEVRKADPKWWLSRRYKEDWGDSEEQRQVGGFHIEIFLGPPPRREPKAIDVTPK